MASKNLFGKARKIGNAYAVIEQGGWRWEILKVNQSLEKARKNPYASAFCAVKSPHTFGSFDMGDTYLSDIPGFWPAIEKAAAKLAPSNDVAKGESMAYGDPFGSQS